MAKIFGFLKFIFHFSILLLIVLSLFPGSLIGLLFYGDLGTQPNIIKNPFGTTINHFISYFYVTMLGLFAYLEDKNFKKLVYVLFCLSLILEIVQFAVPNRAFQLGDLVGNFLGVLVAYFLVKVYLHFKHHE
tara:strand:- start:235 stop:630 length:396 start_codon:yes stop_codon:yes gene_type:complete